MNFAFGIFNEISLRSDAGVETGMRLPGVSSFEMAKCSFRLFLALRSLYLTHAPN